MSKFLDALRDSMRETPAQTIGDLTTLFRGTLAGDALIATLSQKATQFGREFHNPYGSGRSSVIVHPYDKQGSGVSVTFQYTDMHTGEIFSLLCKKLNKRNSPAEGSKNLWDQVGGYTKGAKVEGGSLATLSYEESEHRDAREDAHTATGAGAGIATTTPAMHEKTITKTDLDRFGAAMLDYVREQKRLHPDYAAIHFEAESVKPYLAERGIAYSADYNAKDAAVREACEETSYNGPLSTRDVQVSFYQDDYGVTNVPYLHTVIGHMVVDLGMRDKAPTIYPLDYEGVRLAGSFQPNGSEIGELAWAGSKEIKPAKGNDPSGEMLMHDQRATFQGYFVREDYVLTLAKNLEFTRNAQIRAYSKTGSGRSLYSTAENVEAALESHLPEGKALHTIIGKKPASPFGADAIAYHHRIMDTACYLAGTAPALVDVSTLEARFTTQDTAATEKDKTPRERVRAAEHMPPEAAALRIQAEFRASGGYGDAVGKGRIVSPQRGMV